MTLIKARSLSKHYSVAEKQPGLVGTFSHFFNRNTNLVKAVDQIDFEIDRGEIVGARMRMELDFRYSSKAQQFW